MTFEQAAALPQAGQLAVQALAAAGPLKCSLNPANSRLLIDGPYQLDDAREAFRSHGRARRHVPRPCASTAERIADVNGGTAR
jgi:hypothetical protein